MEKKPVVTDIPTVLAFDREFCFSKWYANYSLEILFYKDEFAEKHNFTGIMNRGVN